MKRVRSIHKSKSSKLTTSQVARDRAKRKKRRDTIAAAHRQDVAITHGRFVPFRTK